MEPNQPATPPPVETVVAPQSPNPVAPKSSLLSKRLLIVAVVLLFLIPILLAGGYFFLMQNKANQAQTSIPTVAPVVTSAPTAAPTPAVDTSSWTTYTSTQSAFTVKYPSQNFVRLVCPDEDLVLKTRQSSDTKDIEIFETCGRDGRFTIEAFAATSLTEPTVGTSNGYSISKEDTTVAGVSARKYTTVRNSDAQGPGPDWSEDIYFDHGGKKYMIHFDKAVTDEIKTKILSTFKFL